METEGMLVQSLCTGRGLECASCVYLIMENNMEFMVAYKDAYGALHNEAVIAADIDAAWDLAIVLVGSENRIQYVWKV